MSVGGVIVEESRKGLVEVLVIGGIGGNIGGQKFDV